MSPASTLISRQQLIEVAEAPMRAFNEKDWARVRASVTPDFVYDEIATDRRVEGVDQAIPLWQGWAAAFPDAQASFDRSYPSDGAVVLELTWRGTHTGPLQTPAGPIAATGRSMVVRACVVTEIKGEKASLQRHYFDMGTLLRQIGVAP